MILHTLNALPSSAAFGDCLKLLQPGDAVVLLGDGVYAALEDTSPCDELRATGVELFILQADALLAGIDRPAEGCNSIGMDELVALTERFPRQLAWY
ncbi:MAG: sulfurtransferase complex subunit TusB [Halioglobus sp.]|nr:sulfurtransferase complex subunit TusB [Halioglobus sp.]